MESPQAPFTARMAVQTPVPASPAVLQNDPAPHSMLPTQAPPAATEPLYAPKHAVRIDLNSAPGRLQLIALILLMQLSELT